jgi:trk system potassium uptake protein TrkH
MSPRLGPVLYVIGMLLIPLGIAMVFPAIADALQDHQDWSVFMTAAGVTVFFGGMLMLATRQKGFTLDRRQAFLLTTLSWVILPAFAALPFTFARVGMDYAQAYFEAMSGLTTTGASVIAEPGDMSAGILLWRALLQLYGGAGIVVVAIAVLPFLRVGGMQLFQLESSERGERVLPRATQIATMTASIYFGLVILCFIAYWAGGMSFFDAVCHAMATVSTGGFSTHGASIGYYQSLPIEAVGSLFMFLGAAPFVIYFRMLRGEPTALYRDQQVRLYLAIVIAGIVVLALWRHFHYGVNPGQAFRESSFNFLSMMTTTGLGSAEYWTWGGLADVVLTMAMLIGGCTGSTTGSIKVFRFNLLILAVRSQLRRLIHPHAAVSATFNERPVSDSVIQSALLFMLTFAALFLLLAIAVSAFGYDFSTGMFAVASTLGNVGGGLGEVVAGGSFGSVPEGMLWVLSLAMLLGRLELFTVLILFTVRFWRG